MVSLTLIREGWVGATVRKVSACEGHEADQDLPISKRKFRQYSQKKNDNGNLNGHLVKKKNIRRQLTVGLLMSHSESK